MMETDLRYPVGKFSRPTAFGAADRAAAIDAIGALPAALRAAVAGLSDAQLDTPYRPDGWTVRQLVHHVADSHVNAYTRARLALTEDTPTIKPYAEAAWAELADAKTMPIDPSLGILDGIHARWTVLLRSIDPAAFAKSVLHPDNGPMTLDLLTALYAWHSRHHIAHITALRARNAW